MSEVTIIDFCGQCLSGKFVDGKCISYTEAGVQRWMAARKCPLGNVDLDKPQDAGKKKVNPLKASKRGRR
jgi:hypothetical protein